MLNDLPCISDASIGFHLFSPSKIPIRAFSAVLALAPVLNCRDGRFSNMGIFLYLVKRG